MGVAVARDHLRSDGRRLETEARANTLFGLGADVAEGANSSRNLADSHILGGLPEPGEAAERFVVPERDLEPKRNRFGMYAVGPADLDRVLELVRTALQDVEQALEFSGD